MEIVIGIIVIVLIYLLIRYVVLPIASVLVVFIIAISACYALVVSLISFISSFVKNMNPYETYVDNHKDIPAGVKRNYCFGPGFHQISEIVKAAFENLSGYLGKLTVWKNKAIMHEWMIDIWIYLGYGFSIFGAQVFGFIWVTVFSAILAIAIMIGMVGFFLFFSELWMTDRTILVAKAIHSRCPKCKRKTVIPIFICPTCGLEHNKLVPGPYGVFERKCVCGTMLSTTFIGGRSQYKANCPFCGAELFSSSSKQYGIQLVGGVGTGKTTFLAAFWHEYKEWLNQKQNVFYEATPADAFMNLDEWFQSGKAEATIETNANMYSIIHALDQKTSVQMTIYDIAGEAFDFANSDMQQQQFRYCEGLLIIIDPTATPAYVSQTIANFIHSLDEIKGKHTSKAATVPIAVIITKADLHKREIGLPRIKASYKLGGDAEAMANSYEKHQNNICRNFLFDHGYENTVNLIEAEFSNLRYFPVSAMGHGVEAGQYEPWGVLEPVFWLMSNENCPLHNILQQQ